MGFNSGFKGLNALQKWIETNNESKSKKMRKKE